MMKQIQKRLPGLLILASVLLLWTLGARAVNKTLFLPSPAQTFEALKAMLQGGGLFRHLGATFGRVSLAILITAAISFPLGMAIALCRPVNVALHPIVKALRFIPVTVFSSILVLTLGIDEAYKVAYLVVATLFSFLPVVIQTASDVDPRLIETAYTMGFSRPRTIVHVILPDILPSLLQSLITTYGVGWTFVIIAELTNAQFGLGHLIYINSARGRTPMVFAAIVVITLVSFLFDKTASFLVKKAFAWRFEDDK